MYINWQVSKKGNLSLVLTSSKEGVYFSRILKFNPAGSIILALLDTGCKPDDIPGHLRGYGFVIRGREKHQITSFVSSLAASGIVQELHTGKDRIIDSFKCFKERNELRRFTEPEILLDKKFPGIANENWSKYLGRYASHEQFFYPVKVNFDITRNCNLKCIFCYLAPLENEKDLPLDKIKIIIDKIKEANVQLINLFGGEPFLRKDIFDIIEYIKQKGLLVTINTNGTLLDAQVINKLKTADIHSLHISLDGDDHKTFSRLRSTESFALVVNNIINSVKAGLPAQVNVTLNKINFFRLPFIYRLSNKIGVPMVSIGGFHAIGIGKENKKLLSLNDATYFFWTRLCKLISFFGKTEVCLKQCDTNSYMHLDHFGNLHFCSQIQRTMPLGNILNQSLLEIWHSEKYRQLFDVERLSEPCKSCIFKKVICNHWRCRAQAYADNNDFYSSRTECLLGKISASVSRLRLNFSGF